MQPQRLRYAASVMRHDAGRRIDGEGHDLLGARARDLLDVHAPRRRCHKGNARAFAVDERREVELALDGRALLDIEAMHLLALRTGLMRDQDRAEQTLRLLAHLLVRFHQLDATGLAASAGVNLRLDDEHRHAELARGLDRLLDRKGGVPARHRDAEFPQHRFGLIFVDVHADLLPAPAPMQHLIVSYLASLTALLHVIRTSSVPRFARDMSAVTSPDLVRSSCKPRPGWRRPRLTFRTWHARWCSTESQQCARFPWRRSRRAPRHRGS